MIVIQSIWIANMLVCMILLLIRIMLTNSHNLKLKYNIEDALGWSCFSFVGLSAIMLIWCNWKIIIQSLS